MKFSDFTIEPHPNYKDGIKMRCELSNGNGISIITGKGSYCKEPNTFEIAPLRNGKLFWVDFWGDQVRGNVTSEEIDIILEHMYEDTQSEYAEFLSNFKFKNEGQTLGDLLDSIITGLK